MKLQVIGNQSPELIRRILDNNSINCHNYEAVGHLVAQRLGMIFSALNSGQGITLCFTAPVHVNRYLREREKKIGENDV
jgi:hypothetical protein